MSQFQAFFATSTKNLVELHIFCFDQVAVVTYQLTQLTSQSSLTNLSESTMPKKAILPAPDVAVVILAYFIIGIAAMVERQCTKYEV